VVIVPPPIADPSSALFHCESFRLDYQTGIETYLLVSRRAKVIVSEDGAQRAIDVLTVYDRIEIPALNRRLGAHPGVAHCEGGLGPAQISAGGGFGASGVASIPCTVSTSRRRV
jgi:hypothetical protein